MADDFTKSKLEWLEALSSDARIGAGAFKTAFLISRHVNRQTGEAWPSLDRLASMQGADERTIRRYIETLCETGYLEKKRGGNGASNRYRLTLSDRTPVSDQVNGRPDTNVHSEEFGSEQTGQPCHSDRTSVSEQTGHPCPPNPLNEPFEEPFESISSEPVVSSECIEEEFERFWLQYPRKKAKGAARKAFEKAKGKATIADILAGVARYAASRMDQDPNFTKHPATWLNQECWGDEVDEPRSSIASALNEMRDGRSSMDAAWDKYEEYLADLKQREESQQSAEQQPERYCPVPLVEAFADDPDTTALLWRLPASAHDAALRKLHSGPYGAQQARAYIRERVRAA